MYELRMHLESKWGKLATEKEKLTRIDAYATLKHTYAGVRLIKPLREISHLN